MEVIGFKIHLVFVRVYNIQYSAACLYDLLTMKFRRFFALSWETKTLFFLTRIKLSI